MGTESCATKKETMQFQAEVKQLLSIVVNSLYTHKEVFLRELISNASDALDKLRILSLTDRSVLEDSPELGIFIATDPANNTISISDNGIGMTYDEVIENIGTIARSGSASFVEYFKANKEEMSLDLIGQFGVGFYSAFMVAEKVTLVTRAAKEEMGVGWESTGDGTYQIEAFEKRDRGTTVTLQLKSFEQNPNSSDEDFLNQYTVQKHVQSHCNFIPYPIRMNFVVEEQPRDEAGKPTGGEKQSTITETVLNSIQPIWARDAKDVSRDDYLKFYKQQFHDWDEPASMIHTQGEGRVEFTSLLFIPSRAPYGLYTGELPKGPQLFCKHVLVMKDCKELLPDYLRFVRGIVDSPDLPLNISRETLQHDRHLQIIRSHLEKKVLEAFKSKLAGERAEYEKLWDEFGKAIKGSIFMDPKNAEKLKDLLLFESSRSSEQKTTLKEYVERMPESQKAIYYVAGDSRSLVARLPQIERVKQKGIELLYFLDKVDEFLTQHLHEYDGKKLQSISRGELELEDEAEGAREEEGSSGQIHDLVAFVRKALGEKVQDVRISKRLISSPVCLVSGDSGYSLNMERLMKEANQTMFRATRILEVNPDHEAIKAIHEALRAGNEAKLSEAEEGRITDLCRLLYNQALLLENHKIEDPVEFADILSQLIVAVCGRERSASN